jgi:hypothetical protein
MALGCVTVACACGSSSGPPSDSARPDASTTGTTSADATSDDAGFDGSSPTNPTNLADASGAPGAEAGGGGPFQPTAPSGTAAANASALCADLHTFLTRCASASCTQAYDSTCVGALAPGESAAFAAAFHHCVMIASSCSDGTGETSCMVPLINAATPTPAQRTLADDFCQACARAPSVVDSGLFCMGEVTPPGSTGRTLSTAILRLSDAYAAKVYAAGCIQQAVAAYPTDYLNCDNTFENCVAAQYPPDPAACSADP